MVRIGLSVEGLTEERFVKQVVEPYLSGKGIYVTPVQLGGNVSIGRACKEIRTLCHSFDFVSTFYDFYGFVGKADNETKESLEQKLRGAIDENLRRKFIPYVQMYEFEGLLFCSPKIIALRLHDQNLEQWANAILDKFGGNPERINDSKETAPSKRLEQKAPYKKTISGPDIAGDIGLVKIRAMCSGFDKWLSSLETLLPEK